MEVAEVIADAAVYTGHHGAVRSHRATLAPPVVNVARAEAPAPNLDLTFLF